MEPPGWRLSWTWEGDEVIWNMVGAEATLQGNCSRFKGNLPHSCEKKPVIVDLLPGTPYNMQVANCCKGGILSSMIQDPSKYGATFHMSVGVDSTSKTETKSPYSIPANFTIELPGYTCGPPLEVPPSRFTSDSGRRWTQAIGTWNVTCIYSQIRASLTPKCCVSLSAFYNTTIVPCPICSCHCQGLPGASCTNSSSKLPPLLQLPHDATEQAPPLVSCTQHMCPIKVHWHVKQSYREYWRVKITITNFNFARNYSRWSLVMQHPNLRSLTEVFSFNYKPLDQHGPINDTGMFWGIQFYNDMLLQSGEGGNVQTEILLNKDAGMFTFREGWAFPRKISFDGDECVMPSPEDYPRLPNGANTTSSFRFTLLIIPCLLILMFIL